MNHQKVDDNGKLHLFLDFILSKDYNSLILRSARNGSLCVPLQQEGCTFIEEACLLLVKLYQALLWRAYPLIETI